MESEVVSGPNEVGLLFALSGIFSGWGRLIFFDIEERSVLQNGFVTVAEIPKLDKSWRIVFDLKPVEVTPGGVVVRAVISAPDYPADMPNICTVFFGTSTACLGTAMGPVPLVVNYQLRIGEWNRVQITHDEGEGGHFCLSLSVNDNEVGIMEIDEDLGEEEFADVRLRLEHPPSTLTRGILVIEKS